jgi:hypothetical protein
MPSSHRPAGGLHSRNVSHTSAPKQEPRPHRASPVGASQLGQKVAYQKDELLSRGGGYSPPQGPTQSVAGPGGGRDVHPSGSQHGLNKNPQAPEPGRSLFEGPNMKLGS